MRDATKIFELLSEFINGAHGVLFVYKHEVQAEKTDISPCTKHIRLYLDGTLIYTSTMMNVPFGSAFISDNSLIPSDCLNRVLNHIELEMGGGDTSDEIKRATETIYRIFK
jgi:hypothetical protein